MYAFLMWLYFSMNGDHMNIWGDMGKYFTVSQVSFLFIWKLQVNSVCQVTLLYTSSSLYKERAT